jgi:hypothetical protein
VTCSCQERISIIHLSVGNEAVWRTQHLCDFYFPNDQQRKGNKLHNTTEKLKDWAIRTPEWTQLLCKSRQLLYHRCAILLLWAKCQMVWDSLLLLLLFGAMSGLCVWVARYQRVGLLQNRWRLFQKRVVRTKSCV